MAKPLTPQSETLPGNVIRVIVADPGTYNILLLQQQIAADAKIAPVLLTFNTGFDASDNPLLILALQGPLSFDPLAELNAVIAAHNPAQKTAGQTKQAAKAAAAASLPQFVIDTNNGVNKNVKDIQIALAALIVALGMDNGS